MSPTLFLFDKPLEINSTPFVKFLESKIIISFPFALSFIWEDIIVAVLDIVFSSCCYSLDMKLLRSIEFIARTLT